MTRTDVLTQLKAGKLSVQEAAALLTPTKSGPLSCRVSRKRAVSVYGLQQMPVTLYAEQWERLLASMGLALVQGVVVLAGS